jgi:hypothetical protein
MLGLRNADMMDILTIYHTTKLPMLCKLHSCDAALGLGSGNDCTVQLCVVAL